MEASLSVHRLKTTPTLLNAHRKALAVAPMKYPITRVEVKETKVSKGSLDALIDNIRLIELPRRMLVTCVSNAAYNGSFSKNPFVFEHYNINFIASYIDGVQHPSIAYQPDFNNDDYVHVYRGLYQALNQNNFDPQITIERTEFIKGKVFFGFNYAPDLSNGCGSEGHLNPVKHGTRRLIVKFAQPLPETITVLFYCEFDSIIEIDKERQVTTDYS